MLHIVSPAKSLNFESEVSIDNYSSPAYLDKSSVLIEKLKKQTKNKLKGLMSISDDLAMLNIDRYASWNGYEKKSSLSKQAVFAFNGDVYQGLDAESLSLTDIKYAQDNLRILSGLYGVLKPLDIIEAHRLEMGTKLKVGRKNNLYEFWKLEVNQNLNELLKMKASKVLVNLASNEYFKVVDKKTLDAEIISPEFKDFKNGDYKIISFYAKKARGLMSRYIIQNRIERAEDLIGFNLNGYNYNPAMSSELKPVFTREEIK